jgi:hypothetical protein
VLIEQGWAKFIRVAGYVIALKSPKSIALYTERNRIGVWVLNLPFGWRVTVREMVR